MMINLKTIATLRERERERERESNNLNNRINKIVINKTRLNLINF